MAFVENVIHGYSNCITCHYSPSGGDMLNDYGRSLSAELMSTWSKDGAEKSFGGFVKETEWMRVGGDLRTLQRYIDTPSFSERALFLMQANVEVGLKYGKTMFVGTLGIVGGPNNYVGGPSDSIVKNDFISERHYVLVETSSTSRVRAGKFRVNFGINDPNHNRPIKRGLGFGSNSEVYNLEYTKFFDTGDILFNLSLGRIDLSRPNGDERSVSAKASHYLYGKSKLGFNYLYGEALTSRRHLLGAFGIKPLTEKSYILYELDYEDGKANFQSSGLRKIINHTRIGYEFFKGFKSYTLFDYQKSISVADTQVTAPGIGLQWLPFPHFEVQIEYQAMKRISEKVNHFGFIMVHSYF